MAKISFVYFDLGGVVIQDFTGTNKWEQLTREIGVPRDRDRDFENFWDKHEAEVCIGRDVETLIPIIRKKFAPKFPDNYSLLTDGFVNRFETNKSIWPVIDKIHQKCKIGLLTNMYPHMLGAIKKNGLLKDVRWDVVIDSSAVGIPKPDTRIFRLAEKMAGFQGKEIMFVDNASGNIDAASDFGWQTFLYDSRHIENSSRRLLTVVKRQFRK